MTNLEMQRFVCGKHVMGQTQDNCPWCVIERLRDENHRARVLILEAAVYVDRKHRLRTDMDNFGLGVPIEPTREPAYPRCACGANEWGPNTTSLTDSNGRRHYRDQCEGCSPNRPAEPT